MAAPIIAAIARAALPMLMRGGAAARGVAGASSAAGAAGRAGVGGMAGNATVRIAAPPNMPPRAIPIAQAIGGQGGIGGGGGGIPGGVGGGLSPPPAQGGQEEASGVWQAIKGTGSAFLRLTGIVGHLALAVPLVTKGLERFGKLVLESNRGLAQYNGTIADSFARIDYQERRLQIQKAQATAGTTKGLADSYGRLREQMAPYDEAFANVKNKLATLAVDIASGILKVVEAMPFVKAVTTYLRSIDKNTKKDGDGSHFSRDFLQAIGDGRYSGHIQPPSF